MKKLNNIVLLIFVFTLGFRTTTIIKDFKTQEQIKDVLTRINAKEPDFQITINTLRKFYNYTYFYSVYRDKTVFKYGTSAFDPNKKWMEGGVYEYDVKGEIVDDGIDYNYLWRNLKEGEIKVITQETTYGFMDSFYIKKGDLLIGIDILREDSPILKTKRDMRIFTLFLVLLLYFFSYFILKYGQWGVI